MTIICRISRSVGTHQINCDDAVLTQVCSESTTARMSNTCADAGVVVGIVSGVLLRMADLSPEQIDVLGFLGELMLRLLKMLVLPLVAGSMVAGALLKRLALPHCPHREAMKT